MMIMLTKETIWKTFQTNFIFKQNFGKSRNLPHEAKVINFIQTIICYWAKNSILSFTQQKADVFSTAPV
jgi:hypothetical protein